MLTGFSPEVGGSHVISSNHNIELTTPQNFDHDLELANALSAFAKQKRVTPAQLAVSWVATRISRHPVAGLFEEGANAGKLD
jgi:aryl-alcohol dehydrogenase-like predicted oxidoreductase